MIFPNECAIQQSGTSNGNVLQSFAYDPINQFIWSTYNHSDPKFTVLNVADVNAPWQPFANSGSGTALGHGTVLIQEADGVWWLDGAGNGEVTRCSVSISGSVITVTPSTSFQAFPSSVEVIIVGSKGDSTTQAVFRGQSSLGDELCRIYNTADIVADLDGGSSAVPTVEFNISNNGTLFQGITLFDGDVWTLTGSSDINETKTLTRYSTTGTLLNTYTITLKRPLALVVSTQQKYEPEGLEVINNKLYCGMMLGEDGDNLKYLLDLSDIIS